ncbi:MAG: hypothetical protein AAB401_06405, partial [Acidobacteriota bacterium]
LCDRASSALRPETYDQGLLRAISITCDGDARLAISTLRRAAQTAEAARTPKLDMLAVTRAEGEKQSAILQAQGAAEARLTAAAAEAESIRHIAVGITGGQGNPAQYLIMMKYIESLREMAKSNNAKVIFMPVETSSVLASIGAFKEVFGCDQVEPRVPVEQSRLRQ